MENNNTSYLKTDDNKVINEKYIRWIKKIDECFEICTRSIGCNIEEKNTHRVCKIYNRDSYNKLNNLFE